MKTVASFLFAVVAAFTGVFAAPTPTQYVRSGVADNVLQAPIVGSTTAPIYSAPVASIAALRALNVTAPALVNGAQISVSGYYAANDGGGGLYVWNSTSTTTDDGGIVIQATGVATGRWIRVYTGPVYADWWGCSGTADDVAINKAIAYVASSFGEVRLLPKTYNTAATINLTNASLIGQEGATRIKPGALVTVAVNMISTNELLPVSGSVQNTCVLEGVVVDGANTSGAVGVQLGLDPPSYPATVGYKVRKFKVLNFAGTGGKGFNVVDVVSAVIEQGDVANCYDGMYFLRHNATNIWPTTMSISDVYTHWNTHRGIDIEDGFGLNFKNVYSEVNGAEGVYITCASGNTSMLMQFDTCQFEGNWSGSSDITKFGVRVLGSPGFVNARFQNCLFAEYGGGEIHVTDAFVLIDNPQSSQYTNASFVLDGSSDVYLQQLSRNFNWGGIIADNTVNGRVVWEGYIADLNVPNVLGEWTDWTPTFSTTAGMTYTGINLYYARYKIVGKTCSIEVSFDGTIGGTLGPDIFLTFPAAIVPKRDDIFGTCSVTPADPGYIAEVRTYNPSGNGFYVRKYENWTAGAARGARITMTFEVQ